MPMPAPLARTARAAHRAALALLPGWLAAGASAGPQLERIRQRDALLCGVVPDRPGFASRDDAGRWHGLDVDICRAVAAAALGSADKARYLALPAAQPWRALAQGEVNLWNRGSLHDPLPLH